MKLHKWKDIERRRFTPEQLAELDRQRAKEDLELSLAEPRRMAGKTQVEVAEAMELAPGSFTDRGQ